jgi:hypothetical protein
MPSQFPPFHPHSLRDPNFLYATPGPVALSFSNYPRHEQINNDSQAKSSGVVSRRAMAMAWDGAHLTPSPTITQAPSRMRFRIGHLVRYCSLVITNLTWR